MVKLTPKESILKPSKDSLTKLFLLYVIYQLILHLYFTLSLFDIHVLVPTSIAFFHDISVLGITAGLGYIIKFYSPPSLKRAVDILFSILLIIVGVSLASYPRVLREFLAYSVNVFESDISSIKVFVSDYLGIDAFLQSLLALVIGMVIYFINVRISIPYKIKRSGLFFIILIFGFTLMSFSPQPFVYSIQKKVERFLKNEPRTVSTLDKSTKTYGIAEKLSELSYPSNDSLIYDHLILIVMEGVTSETFEKEFFSIKDGFYSQQKEKLVYYNNFYTSNLDSYTSLISMATSIQVPFRAYADESLYTKVNEAPSIMKEFRDRGFFNMFISTYEYEPFVPTRKDWDKIYERKDLPPMEGWISLESSRMESATEDKAAIPTIIENMKSNEKTFILHELVYGHSSEWKIKTGISKIDYYSEYLVDLSDRIEQENLSDKTLFIIVSDHGDRSKSAVLENYRVPLLVVGDHNTSQVRDELISHRDISKIICQYVALDEAPASRDTMFLVGSTEKWVYGRMNKEKEYLFIDDGSGIILSKNGDLDPIKIREDFQDHVGKFNSQYGKN